MEEDFDRALADDLQPVFQKEKSAREAFCYGPHPWVNGLRFVQAQRRAFEKLDSFIERNGWPTSLLVGQDVAAKVADLVLNLVTQPGFMRESLPVIEQKYRFGEVSSETFCSLYDKLMWLDSKPQLFGAFLEWGAKGSLVAPGLLEPSRLEIRRKGFFLEPFGSFVERVAAKFEEKGRFPPKDLATYEATRDKFLVEMGWSRKP